MPKTRRQSNRRRRQSRRQKAGAAELQATILDQASTQVLKFLIPPGGSLITDQNTLAYMSGHLKTEASTGTGLWNALKRGITGESFLSNVVTNPSQETAELVLAPSLAGAITEITIQPGTTWRLYPGSFMAATPNVKMTGSLRMYESFRLISLAGDTIFYTSVEVPAGEEPGRVWIYGFGGIEEKTITPTSTPYILNNGTFLAMPHKTTQGNLWDAYVSVGTPGSLMESFLTQIGFVMKIQAKEGQTGPSFPLYTQTLNIENLKHFVRGIAQSAAKSVERSYDKNASFSDKLESGMKNELVEKIIAKF